MINIYWPVYKNIESEVIAITYDIHIDDNQLNVYSSKISDLILRASAEIESISKELYKQNNGTKTEKIKFDYDALEHLNNIWNLDKKVVILSSINCFQSNKKLYPFEKNEESSFTKKQTYNWNNSYQNLKHDRANSIKFGSIRYLFSIMSALYLLNIYYRKEAFELKSKATDIPLGLGSDLFSIKVHEWVAYNSHDSYLKNKDFDECVYVTKITNDGMKGLEFYHQQSLDIQKQLVESHPKYIDYIGE